MGDPITTHCLDTGSGFPANNLRIVLHQCIDETNLEAGWEQISEVVTNSDGRGPGFTANVNIKATVYKAVFYTQDYFERAGLACFYPKVDIIFRVTDPSSHYHIPLLLSPYGYSTYRGS
jgi:5-hydroxyisourate hydrolase